MTNKNDFPSLYEYARRELEAAGLLDADSDYNGAVGEDILGVVALVAQLGHSGESRKMFVEALSKILLHQPLVDIGNPFERGEYADVSEAGGLPPGTMLQSTRKTSVFSKDGGATWYDLDNAHWFYPPHLRPPSPVCRATLELASDGETVSCRFEALSGTFGQVQAALPKFIQSLEAELSESSACPFHNKTEKETDGS